MDLRSELLKERLAAYRRLRGGFPIPLAGAVYWAGLAVLSQYYGDRSWSLLSFYASGLIFPMALLFAKLFRNDFMKDRTAVSDVLFPTFISMLLFWPMAITAFYVAPQLVVLIMAIGLSIHWPVIGWSYGRPGIYTAHSVVRAILATAIWFALPDDRLLWISVSVCAVYLITTLIIYVDSGRMQMEG